ncbi:winged helix-turn-helix domain-containing protein [Actinomadura vinacea]|uniref:winged helix-turn-helix domain-containing protein n=1 Tax=Actinomadura vinacea TaxID=115336 RepID=UPI0031D90748
MAAAADPMWEIVLSLHILQTRRPAFTLDKWRREVRGRFTDQRRRGQLARLMPLAPIATYMPDFLTPSHAAGNLVEGIDAVLSTPPPRLRREMQRLGAVSRLPAWAGELAAGKSDPLHNLGKALGDYHRFALAPYWHHIQERVDTDRTARGQALLDGGPEHLLETLSPQTSWRRPVLEINYPVDRDLRLDGRGITLLPSFFCQTYPITLADVTLPPVLVYPIAQAGFPSAPTAEGLSALLGATRAAILVATRPGRSTGELAKLLNVSAGTVSYHVSALRDAELVISRRNANMVVHTTTPLGGKLLHGRHQSTTRP